MLQENVQHWKQLQKQTQLNSLTNKYITIYSISQEINFETNRNKIHIKENHFDHLRIWLTKVMKNTGFIIKQKHL